MGSRYFGNEVKFKNNIDTLKHHFIPQQYLKKFNALALEKNNQPKPKSIYFKNLYA